MGSSEEEEEEERFVQMVRDFIESESTTPFPLLHQNPDFLSLQKILEEISDVETEVLEKILLYLGDNGNDKNVKELVVGRLKMDNYEASICKTSWISTFGRPSGVYEYIDIMMGTDFGTNKSPTRLIIDMDFRSQFELARPTHNYTELTNALPSIFVGTEEKLNRIISLLCPAAKQSLKDRGLHIPPWRKLSYMQSKWLSENCKKLSISPAGREMDKRAPAIVKP